LTDEVISQTAARRTPLQADGACEALPHKDGTKPKLNTYALYPNRSKLQGIL